MAIHGRPTSSKSPYGNLGVMLSEAVKSSPYYEEAKNEKIKAEKLKGYKEEDERIEKRYGKKLASHEPELRKLEMAELLRREGKGKEEQESESEKEKNNIEIVKYLAKERNLELTPEQEKAAAKNLSIFEKSTKPVKEPAGTQASKPIDPQQLKAIEDVESDPEWESASIPQKNRMLQKAGVSKENSKSVIDPFIEEEKISTEGKKATAKTEAALRKEEIQFHKESEEYEKELAKGNKSAEHQLNAIKDVEKALKSKETSPTSLANVFTFFGKTGKKLADSILTGNQATIAASVPAFLEGRKELFGVRLSDADLAILEDKLPSMGKSKEANKAILKIMKKYSQGAQLRYKIASDIKAKNKGLRPLAFSNLVEERYEEMNAPVRMRTPNGKVIEVPAYQVSDAISQGVTLDNE